MELAFDRKRNREERLAFVRFYAKWVKSVPNGVWSRQQADLVDSLVEGSRAEESKEAYLKMVKARKEHGSRRPPCH